MNSCRNSDLYILCLNCLNFVFGRIHYFFLYVLTKVIVTLSYAYPPRPAMCSFFGHSLFSHLSANLSALFRHLGTLGLNGPVRY